MGKRKISINTDKIASFVHLNKIIELSLTEDDMLDMLDTWQLLEVRSGAVLRQHILQMYVQHTMQPSVLSIDGPITDIEELYSNPRWDLQ